MTPKPASQGSVNTQTVDAVVAQVVQTSCDAVKLTIHQCRSTAELVCRLVCLTGELGTSCLNQLAACVSAPAPTESTKPPAQGAASGMPVPIIQVASQKLAEVTLSPLTPASPVVVPAVAGLHSVDPALRAITNVSFSAAPGGTRLVLRVRIDDDQQAGSYSGSVIDSETYQPIGTLTVRIL